MSHPYYHAVSAARRLGSAPEDYLAVHQRPRRFPAVYVPEGA